MKYKNRNLFSKIWFIVTYPLRLILVGAVWVYKGVTFWLPHTCRFTPTCSGYMLKAIKEYGIIKGGCMGVWRICRCNPWNKGGFDPVRDNIKGDIKWLI